MPRIPGTTDRESSFLRAFRQSPAGPPAHQWPSPAILRRWLRRPAFRAAIASLHLTLKFQNDFLIAAAANQSLRALADTPDAIDHGLFLRLAHLRQRFPADPHPEPHLALNDIEDPADC